MTEDYDRPSEREEWAEWEGDSERYQARIWEESDYDVTDLVDVHPQIIDYEEDGGKVILIIDTVEFSVVEDIIEACERLYPVQRVDTPRVEGKKALAPLQRIMVC